MYILIELVPVATGTGFGVFCCVVLGLALLFIMAQYAMILFPNSLAPLKKIW